MRPFVDAPEAPWSPQHEARLQRLRRLSRVLDAQWSIPGTRYRVGLDGLVGLIPGVGDAAGALLSTYILYEAMRLGAPRTGAPPHGGQHRPGDGSGGAPRGGRSL